MITATSVSRLFFADGRPLWAVRDLSLEVKAGEFVSLLGPTGCGKSTLLRILGGLDQPTSGSVSSQETAAFVFQEYGVFPWMNVVDNVAFALRMSGVPKRARTQLAQVWLERVGLFSSSRAYPSQLSGGMKQRVALARAFATPTSLLLMDEPLAALDAQTRLLMQELLMQLWERERKTVVLVTHSIDEALLLSDRVVVMSARPGRVKREITIPFRRPRTMEVERTPEFAELRMLIWELLRTENISEIEATA